MEFALCWGGGATPVIGFHASGSERGVIDVARCPLQHDEANRVLDSVRSFVTRRSSRDAWRSRVRCQARLLIRRSDLSGEIQVGLREAARPLPQARELAAFLMRRHEKVTGVIKLIAPTGRRGGTRAQVLAGRDWIEERVAGSRVKLPVMSFLQVSTSGAQALVQLVHELAGEVESAKIVELYGGVGLFSMDLVRRGAASATVCEADLGTITAGREAVAEAGLHGIDFVREDVRSFVTGRADRGDVDLIVANPPRTGLGKGVARSVRSWGSARMILISCDPATLARDLKVFVEDGLYRVERIVPIDLFPQTAHIETAVLLTSA
jgi:tRNA/tmRNA/rRNA uracil-C5-methylase (TrmA/RlmC/RlmD family)